MLRTHSGEQAADESQARLLIPADDLKTKSRLALHLREKLGTISSVASLARGHAMSLGGVPSPFTHPCGVGLETGQRPLDRVRVKFPSPVHALTEPDHGRAV